MRTRLALLTILAIPLSACRSGALEDAFARGRTTSFAAVAVASDGAPPPGTPSGIGREADDAALKEVRASLERAAAEARERAAHAPGDPRRLGYEVQRGVSRERLKEGLSLDIVLGAAFEMSPAIAAAGHGYRATVEQFDQIAYLDDLLRQYTAFTKDLDLRFGAQRQKELVGSRYPFPGTLALKSRIVSEEARAAEARLDATVRTTLVQAGKAWLEYVYAGQAIEIVKANINLLQKGMVEIAESRYGLGKTKQGVVLKIHTEVASLDDQLITLKDAERTARARLASVVGLDASFPLGAAGTTTAVAPPAQTGSLQARAFTSRQEIQALDARIARAEALIELAETKAYPDLSLGYSRFEEGAGTRVGGARMKEPFAEKPSAKPPFFFGESASFVQEMRRRLEAMRSERADLVARVGFQVKDALFRWDVAWRQTELYRTSLLPQSEQAYQVLESGWREGVAGFLDALDAQRMWLRYRLQERAAVRDSQVGRLSLLDAVGADLSGDGGKER